MSKKPVALIIMDGFGYNASDYGNAITCPTAIFPLPKLSSSVRLKTSETRPSALL